MEITQKGNILIVDNKSIVISAIKSVTHDTVNVYIVLNSILPGMTYDIGGITMPFASVTIPRVFASAVDLHSYIDDFRDHTGIINGTFPITLSDSVDCSQGYIKVKNNGAAGTIKYTTVLGDVDSDSFLAGQVSEFRVKRVWLNGTDVSVNYIRILV